MAWICRYCMKRVVLWASWINLSIHYIFAIGLDSNGPNEVDVGNSHFWILQRGVQWNVQYVKIGKILYFTFCMVWLLSLIIKWHLLCQYLELQVSLNFCITSIFPKYCYFALFAKLLGLVSFRFLKSLICFENPCRQFQGQDFPWLFQHHRGRTSFWLHFLHGHWSFWSCHQGCFQEENIWQVEWSAMCCKSFVEVLLGKFMTSSDEARKWNLWKRLHLFLFAYSKVCYVRLLSPPFSAP